MRVSGSNAGRSLGEVAADIESALAAMHLPPGYDVRPVGDSEELKKICSRT